MAHHVHQTSAFILKGLDSGDANRFIDLFTKELGLVRAAAQSVRRERSKLRYSLQEYTFGTVSLVRGREVWRITGAKEEGSMYHALKHEPPKLMLFGRILFLLRRLLHGEEKNEYLFDVIQSLALFLDGSTVGPRELKGVEYLTVLRILHTLGYISRNDDFLTATSFEHAFLETVLAHEKNVIREINEGLRESQL